MKNVLIFLIGLLSVSFSLFAQEQYIPLTEQDGVKWVYYLIHGSDTIPYTIEFTGDTLVNNHNVVGLVSHNLLVRKCYMTFSKPIINPSNGKTIFDASPLLVGWGFDWNYKTYIHYTKDYRSKVRRYSLPMGIVDDEFDADCFHSLGRVSFIGLEQANSYWESNMPDQFQDCYRFVTSDEIEVDGHKRTLYSSAATSSSYYSIDNIQMQTFMLDGIGWYGRYFKSSNSEMSRSNMSNFLSPFGQLRGNFDENNNGGTHIDDLYNPYSESLFSHQEKNGTVIFKSPWYLGDGKAVVGIDKVIKDSTDTDPRWYSVTGVAYDTRPAQPGIYIHQGNKVVIK